VVTAAARDREVRPLPAVRTSPSVFETSAELLPGDNVLVATGRTLDGSRMRAELRLKVPPP